MAIFQEHRNLSEDLYSRRKYFGRVFDRFGVKGGDHMNTDDLRRILREHENRITRTVTIPLDEYEELKRKIKYLNDENSDLNYALDRSRGLWIAFGFGGIDPNDIVKDSIMHEVNHNIENMTTTYRITFKVPKSKWVR